INILLTISYHVFGLLHFHLETDIQILTTIRRSMTQEVRSHVLMGYESFKKLKIKKNKDRHVYYNVSVSQLFYKFNSLLMFIVFSIANIYLPNPFYLYLAAFKSLYRLIIIIIIFVIYLPNPFLQQTFKIFISVFSNAHFCYLIFFFFSIYLYLYFFLCLFLVFYFENELISDKYARTVVHVTKR
ncbi:hypothetical protein ACJX0J_034458, partial [Zea mays]